MQGAHILTVDDDRHIRDLIGLILEDGGHRCTGAGSASEAWEHLRNDDFELVLCDVRMPGQSGLELARHIIAEHPDTPVVMVTGLDDAGIGQAALAFGAYGYVIKPFRQTDLLMNVENALHRRRQEIAARGERDALERSFEDQAGELKEAMLNMRESARAQRLSGEDTVKRLSRAIEFRSRETWEHIERMGELSALLARRLGFDPAYVEMIRVAAPMHDVGKVAVPDAVLLKPGPLDPQERSDMERHTVIGHEVLSGSETEVIQLAASIALTHHERFDGTGYPEGIGEREIPVEGRIAAVADVFDAVTSDRVYRKALPVERALEMVDEGSGSQFDPQVAERLLGSVDEVEQIRLAHSERVPA
jgi:putative two-component system response regulator